MTVTGDAASHRRRALVTGGGAGIGASIAEALTAAGVEVGRRGADPHPDRPAFGWLNLIEASKWAVEGLTRTRAAELGPEGIRVNCVAPGTVDGERMDRVIAAEAAARGTTVAAVRRGGTDAATAHRVGVTGANGVEQSG